mgnify:CR=1 FL=1
MKHISIEAVAATLTIMFAPLHDKQMLRRRFRSDSACDSPTSTCHDLISLLEENEPLLSVACFCKVDEDVGSFTLNL